MIVHRCGGPFGPRRVSSPGSRSTASDPAPTGGAPGGERLDRRDPDPDGAHGTARRRRGATRRVPPATTGRPESDEPARDHGPPPHPVPPGRPVTTPEGRIAGATRAFGAGPAAADGARGTTGDPTAHRAAAATTTLSGHEKVSIRSRRLAARWADPAPARAAVPVRRPASPGRGPGRTPHRGRGRERRHPEASWTTGKVLPCQDVTPRPRAPCPCRCPCPAPSPAARSAAPGSPPRSSPRAPPPSPAPPGPSPCRASTSPTPRRT